MGTLNVLVRNNMLSAIDGSGSGSLNYIELENDIDHDFGRHAISWQSASNGERVQDGTITIVKDLDIAEQGLTITGFRFYFDNSTSTSNGNGTFDESVQLEDGNEYTINVSGITISLPE